MEIPETDISVSASIESSLVWNFHMSWAATDISDWLLQLVLGHHCINIAVYDQSFISYFQQSACCIIVDKVIDLLANSLIVQLGQLSMLGLDILADTKSAV